MSVETLSFDTFLEQLAASVGSFGGYVESSSVGNRGYRNGQQMRYANYSIRIPADQLDTFLNTVSDLGNVTFVNTSLRDVTTNYVDSEKHLESLRIEQQALMEILAKATTVEDIITVQDRLTYVRYEIESYEAILRTYDDQIALSTVSLSVNEVVRETPVEKETFGQEVSRRFKESLSNVGDGFRTFGAWLIGDAPEIIVTLLILAAVVLVIVLIIRAIVRGSRKRKQKKAQAKNNNEATRLSGSLSVLLLFRRPLRCGQETRAGFLHAHRARNDLRIQYAPAEETVRILCAEDAHDKAIGGQKPEGKTEEQSDDRRGQTAFFAAADAGDDAGKSEATGKRRKEEGHDRGAVQDFEIEAEKLSQKRQHAEHEGSDAEKQCRGAAFAGLSLRLRRGQIRLFGDFKGRAAKRTGSDRRVRQRMTAFRTEHGRLPFAPCCAF